MTRDDKVKDEITTEELHPGLTPEWYAEAEVNVHRYLRTVIGITERLHSEGKTVEDLKSEGSGVE